MRADEYALLDATAIADLVRRGQVTADEVRKAAAEQHEATDETIHAVVEWYDDPDPGGESGLLGGVPFLRKDYGSTEAGRLVESGSRLAEGRRASTTSEYFTRLKAAGAQVLGRSAVPEFIQHGSTESRAFGTTRNPHNSSLSAGGSSGGAAAAVAAGVVPAAHASDCAGSIRIPAATCGLVGLKPGWRRVPWAEGGWGGIAEEFVLTRSVRDAALFLDVLGVGEYIGTEELASPTSLRVAISTDHWGGAATDPVVVDAAVLAADRLAHLGHNIDVIGVPVDNDLLMSTWHPLFSRWVARDVRLAEVATGRVAGTDTLEPLTLLLLDELQNLTVGVITESQVSQGYVTERLRAEMEGFDVMLTPSLGRPTIPLNVVAGEVDSMDDYLRVNDELFTYSYLFNVAGWPSLSVPFGTTDDGLPLGVQLSARRGHERTLLDLAKQLV